MRFWWCLEGAHAPPGDALTNNVSGTRKRARTRLCVHRSQRSGKAARRRNKSAASRTTVMALTSWRSKDFGRRRRATPYSCTRRTRRVVVICVRTRVLDEFERVDGEAIQTSDRLVEERVARYVSREAPNVSARCVGVAVRRRSELEKDAWHLFTRNRVDRHRCRVLLL